MNTEPRGASGSASGEAVSRASVLWGPISPEASRRAGAAFPTSSVLLRPELPCGVAEAATAVVSDAVLARPDDTASTLQARLAQSSFLEDIHVLKGGRGPARVRLNATCYPEATCFPVHIVLFSCTRISAYQDVSRVMYLIRDIYF